MRTVTASGLLLGALLAATAAAVKILFLNEIEERYAAPTAS